MIVAGTAIKGIDSTATDDLVVATQTINGIGTIKGSNEIGALGAIGGVIAGSQQDHGGSGEVGLGVYP